MSNVFHDYCNITDSTYKGVGRWEGVRVGGGGRWATGYRLCHPIGLFGELFVQEALIIGPDRPRGISLTQV